MSEPLTNDAPGRQYVQVSYWLQLAVSYDCYGSGLFEMRERLARLVRGCGVACDASQVRVSMHHIEPPPRRIPAFMQDWLAYGTVDCAAPALDYPAECGDWSCAADHWARANPLAEPAVYAGVAAESTMVDAVAWSPLAIEMIQHRRDARAAGRPLWTVDLRPDAMKP